MKKNILFFVVVVLIVVPLRLLLTGSGDLPTEKRMQPEALDPTALALAERTYLQPVDLYNVGERIWKLEYPRENDYGACLEDRLGATREFRVVNADTGSVRGVHARLEFSDDQVMLWVEDGLPYPADLVQPQLIDFENRTQELLWGLDRQAGFDSRSSKAAVLITRSLGKGVAGYFAAENEYPSKIVRGSNNCPLVFVNADEVDLQSDILIYTIAHELGHRFIWQADPNEVLWVSEGLADLMSLVNRKVDQKAVEAFIRSPDVKWTSNNPPDHTEEEAGAALLFFTYLRNRFGDGFLGELMGSPEDGFAGIENAVYVSTGQPQAYEDLLIDWVAHLTPGVFLSISKRSPGEGKNSKFWSSQ